MMGWVVTTPRYDSSLLLLSIGLVSGCASANHANTASDDIDSDEVVEMVVLNRTLNSVTVFAWWEGGARLRLGELRGLSNRTFTTRLWSRGVWLSVDELSKRGLGRGDRPKTFVPVRPGDRIEWDIGPTFPSIDLFYQRLPSR